jgi:hypothetical protein
MITTREIQLLSIIESIRQVASGENQVAIDDTGGMEWITRFIADNIGVDGVLLTAGYEIVTGADAVLNLIADKSDGATESLCSGYGVFPDGKKCEGCSDCRGVKVVCARRGSHV